MVFRAAIKDFPDIEIVGINDLLEPDYLAHMLKYDSVHHGRFKGDIAVDGNDLIVNGKKIRLTAVKDPAELNWGAVGADIVVESTGLFLDKAGAEAHQAGAKKVIMSAPSTMSGRHPDVRVRREPLQACWRGHHLQRLLHHQLPGPVAKVPTTTGASSVA